MVHRFTELLGPAGVLTEDLERYEEGWRYGHGKARLVLRPASTEEVSQTLALAHELGLQVVPQGANTGLVGASVPDESGSQVILSLERLSRIEEIDPLDRVAVVQGGVLLSRLNEALAEHGLTFPVDLGADPQLGGMVATNTGGTRLLKYGDVRHNLLGVEVVLADGTVVSALHRLRKDNTGLDLKQLFTGTFGTLGVVTRAVLSLVPLPRQRAAALVALSTGQAVLELLRGLEMRAHGLVSAFEVMSAGALEPVFAHTTNLRDPYQGEAPAPFSVLVELDTTLRPAALDLPEHLAEVLSEVIEDLDGLEDAFLGEAEDFWAIRHAISEAHRGLGRVLGLDVSVPRSRLAIFREQLSTWLSAHHPWLALRDFGHWGDGGVHLNLSWDPSTAPADAEALAHQVQDHVYEVVVREHGGSFSAEHGIGPHNQRSYEAYADPAARRLAQAIASVTGRLGRVEL